MSELSLEHWQKLMGEWGFTDNKATFIQLSEAYQQPHRAYHNANHVNEVLAVFGKVRHLAKHPKEIELAIWFHDAIYDTASSTNEKDSAQWAKAFVESNDGNGDAAQRVYRLIMLTASHCGADTIDEAIMLDSDLCILGSDEGSYNAYEQQIRAEYSWVPDLVFYEKRQQVMKQIADQDRIFKTDHFYHQYERAARLNLQRYQQ